MVDSAKMVTGTKCRDDRSRGCLDLRARQFEPVTTFAESTISEYIRALLSSEHRPRGASDDVEFGAPTEELERVTTLKECPARRRLQGLRRASPDDFTRP